MRLEKLDLIEWGWHKIGDPTKPKSGFLWGNPEWPEFWVLYDELEGNASVLHRYSKAASDVYSTIRQIYSYMNLSKGYEHEWDDDAEKENPQP